MDQGKTKTQKIAFLNQSIECHHYLIKLAPLLLSVTLFPFLFSSSSLLVFLHHFNFCFSTFPFQLFTHTLDKNCMFLLCNGLLVFVGITRSFSGSSCDDDEASKKYMEDDSQSQFPDVEANKPLLETVTKLDVQNTTAAEEAIEIKYSTEEVQENIEAIIAVDEEGEEESGQSVFKEMEEPETGLFEAVDEEEEGEEVVEEENGELSTEELNRKFDEFIRKMREDLRIEARRQLVIV